MKRSDSFIVTVDDNENVHVVDKLELDKHAMKAQVDYDGSKQIVEDSYSGSLPAFVAAFISNKKLTAKEADEIQKMIDEFKKN